MGEVYPVTSGQRDEVTGKFMEIQRQMRLKKGSSINPLEVSPMMQLIIDHRGVVPTQEVPLSIMNDYFSPPELQIDFMARWNLILNLGYSLDDFVKLGFPDHWPQGRLAANVLVPYGDSWDETFIMLTNMMDCVDPRPPSYHWPFPNNVQLRFGQHCRPRGLYWERIDFGARRGEAPKEMDTAKDLPHAGVMAAVVMFPYWLAKMGSEDVPYVWIPGCSHTYRSAEYPNEPSVPHLRSTAIAATTVEICGCPSSFSLCSHAIPVFVR